MDGVVVLETQYSKKFMLHIMRSIDYSALCYTTKEVRVAIVGGAQYSTRYAHIDSVSSAPVATVEPSGGPDLARADFHR